MIKIKSANINAPRFKSWGNVGVKTTVLNCKASFSHVWLHPPYLPSPWSPKAFQKRNALPDEHLEQFSVEASSGVQEEMQGLESSPASNMVSWKHTTDSVTLHLIAHFLEALRKSISVLIHGKKQASCLVTLGQRWPHLLQRTPTSPWWPLRTCSPAAGWSGTFPKPSWGGCRSGAPTWPPRTRDSCPPHTPEEGSLVSCTHTWYRYLPWGY